MSIYTPDETTLRNLAAEIDGISPRPHHSELLEIANRIRPGCTFRYALNRGGCIAREASSPRTARASPIVWSHGRRTN